MITSSEALMKSTYILNVLWLDEVLMLCAWQWCSSDSVASVFPGDQIDFSVRLLSWFWTRTSHRTPYRISATRRNVNTWYFGSKVFTNQSSMQVFRNTLFRVLSKANTCKAVPCWLKLQRDLSCTTFFTLADKLLTFLAG